MYDPSIGRWNGVDPQSEKYLSISSFAYVANNPLIFIDPNGEEIWITTVNGLEVQYRKGKLYTSNGKRYKARENSFTANTLEALNHIRKKGGKVGKNLINTLAKAPADTEDGTGFKVNIEYQEGGGTYRGDRGVGRDHNIKGPLDFDPSIGLVNENGEILSPAGILAHELGHGFLLFDDYSGTKALNKIKWFDTADMQYSSQEEREVIERIEQPISNSFGTPFNRNQHGLINDITTKIQGGVTSNIPQDAKSANQKASKLRKAMKDPASYRKQRFYNSGADPKYAPWIKN